MLGWSSNYSLTSGIVESSIHTLRMRAREGEGEERAIKISVSKLVGEAGDLD